jgi:RNA-directed DNA polymerase
MDGMQPKIQLELAFPRDEEVKPGSARTGGTEPAVTGRRPEHPTPSEPLMEEILSRDNLMEALKRVRANKGSAGVDRMSVDDLPAYLKTHWLSLRDQLLRGTYTPQPVRRVEIPKPSGGVRQLGIPTVLDRFIQQAVLQVLQRRWDVTVSEHSYGFRPGRSAHQAVAQAQQYVADGHTFVVDIDLEKFFDRVNHDILMSRVAQRVGDKRVLRLIRAYLQAGVMEGGLVSPTEEGTPQGGPLSPLLSNLLLDELDRELERRGHRFVRYADDCNIYVRSERAGQRVMVTVTRFLATKLRLKVNERKSAVARPQERSFLGFSFTADEPPQRCIAPRALERFKQRVRELTRRTRGVRLERVIADLAVYLRGWNGYFGYCETPGVFQTLNGWIRRRLRCYLWKQWRTRRNRFDELRKRGAQKAAIAMILFNKPAGEWKSSMSIAVKRALPNAYFRSIGLPELTIRGGL